MQGYLSIKMLFSKGYLKNKLSEYDKNSGVVAMIFIAPFAS